MLNWALKYWKMGLSIIPLKPNGKEPLYPWKEFQTRKASEEEIRKWWTAVPNANIGIVLGKISNLIAIDVDGAGLVQSQQMNLQSSCVTLSGGNGRHFFYRYNGEEPRRIWKGNGPHEEIFLRSDGEYIVAPPSVHPNGRRYRWLSPFTNAKQLLSLPENVVSYVGTNGVQGHLPEVGKPDDWISQALEEMKNGHIHNTLISVLGKFRSHNFDSNAVVTLLAPLVQQGGMSVEELEAKVQEIWERYEPNQTRPDVLQRVFQSSTASEAVIIHSPTNRDSWKQFNDRQRDLESDNSSLIQTGYPKLDEMLVYGLKSSRLLVIAARTGVGKTNFVIGITKNVCQSGKRVLLFSTEMPYEEIWTRYLATLKDREEFKQHQLYICDSFAPNLEKVEEIIAEIKPDLFIFDHINHVAEDVRPLGEFMQGLNWLKRKYECAGIVTAQLNRAADWVDLKTGEKVTPRMSMIKGSGTIEQAASRVLLLSETKVTPECTEIVGNLDKNDNGMKGLLHFGLFQNPWRIEQL